MAGTAIFAEHVRAWHASRAASALRMNTMRLVAFVSDETGVPGAPVGCRSNG
jgi:hypothetical protein